MGSYSHKYWSCPFFKWDEKCSIHCEGGVLKFNDYDRLSEYADRYCTDAKLWHKCTVAAALEDEYNREEEDYE